MHVVRVDELRPGHVLGRAVMDERGVLLQSGVELKDHYVQALRNKGYSVVYVRDEDFAFEVETYENVSARTRIKALRALEKALGAIREKARPALGGSVESARAFCTSEDMTDLTSEGGPLTPVQHVADEIIEEVLSGPQLAAMPFVMSEQTAPYEHAVDVCILGLLLGRAIDLPYAKARQLAAGSLLHDIGMLFSPPGVDEPERIRLHTELGFEALRSSKNADILSPHVAYEHHEHQDGTGLPRGLVGGNGIVRNRGLRPPVPSLIGEMAAIANAYDSMLRGSTAAPPVRPEEALQRIRDRAGTWFNEELVSLFVTVVPMFPAGSEAVVEGGDYDGSRCIVMSVKTQGINKPKVAFYKDPQGNAIEPLEVDLRELSDVTLASVTG